MPQITSFEPLRRYQREISAGGDNELEIQEWYSEWKDWTRTSDNLKWAPAWRYIGGDPISDVQNAGITHFLINNWRIIPAELSHNLILNGNIFTDPAGDLVWVPTDGTFTVGVEIRVSNLVDSSVARLDLAQLQEEVWIDLVNGSPGTDSDQGTPTNPVSNEADALTIAARDNLRAFKIVEGTLTLTQAYTNWMFTGRVSKDSAIVELNGQNVNLCSFQKVSMNGTGSGQISATLCEINNLDGVSGLFQLCGVTNQILPASTGLTQLIDCFSEVPGNSKPMIDCKALSSPNLLVRRWSGGALLKNIDQAGQLVSFDMTQGRLEVDNTNTDGILVVGGVGTLEDNSAGTTVYADSLNSLLEIKGDNYVKGQHSMVKNASLVKTSIGLS